MRIGLTFFFSITAIASEKRHFKELRWRVLTKVPTETSSHSELFPRLQRPEDVIGGHAVRDSFKVETADEVGFGDLEKALGAFDGFAD